MASLLEQLENNEAILLMYVAGELPPEDQAEVEHMLATDPSLRCEFQKVRDLHEAVWGEMDTVRSMTSADEMAVRRTLREMRRFELELAARPVPAPRPSLLHRMPRWAYPVAAAAAVVFLMVSLWGLGVFDGKPRPVSAGNTEIAQGSSQTQESEVEHAAKEWVFFPDATRLDEAAVHADELRDTDNDDALLLMM